MGQRKAFYRQRIEETGCDRDTLIKFRNDNIRFMPHISVCILT